MVACCVMLLILATRCYGCSLRDALVSTVSIVSKVSFTKYHAANITISQQSQNQDSQD